MDPPIRRNGEPEDLYNRRLEEIENEHFKKLTKKQSEKRLLELQKLKEEKQQKQLLVQEICEIYPKAHGFKISAYQKGKYSYCSMEELKKTIEELKKETQIRSNRKASDAKRKQDKIDAAPRVLEERKLLFRKAYEKHYTTLKRNFGRRYRKNDYGAVELDERFEEFEKFLKSAGFVISTPLGNRSERNDKHDPDFTPNVITMKKVNYEFKKIKRRIASEDKAAKKAGFNPDNLPKNGLDFERWVAKSLNDTGWKTNVTVGSGDQGVDVIAEYQSITVGIQCKLYSGSVGNKAVQEIKSGIEFHQCDYGVVITNGKYTKSAQDLAKSTDILLLKHTEIPNLLNIIKDQ